MGNEISLQDLYSGRNLPFNTLWHEHVTQWENNPYGADILWTKFEDLVNRKQHELRRICNFLGISRTEEMLAQVVEYTSIDHMKTLEKRKDWTDIKKNRFIAGRDFIRQGKADSFLCEVPSELLHVFEVQNSASLKKHYPELCQPA